MNLNLILNMNLDLNLNERALKYSKPVFECVAISHAALLPGAVDFKTSFSY